MSFSTGPSNPDESIPETGKNINNKKRVFNINRILVNRDTHVLYYLKDGPKSGFVRGELRIVPPGTKLPLEEIC